MQSNIRRIKVESIVVVTTALQMWGGWGRALALTSFLSLPVSAV